MPLAQLVHQVLCVLAVLTALALVVLAGVAELQTPNAPPPEARAPVGAVAVALERSQRANVERHDDALARVELAGFTLVSLGVLMLFAALAGAAPAPFRNVTVAFLALAALQALLFELTGTSTVLAALHLVAAAVVIAVAARAVARHVLLPAPWETALRRDAAIQV